MAIIGQNNVTGMGNDTLSTTTNHRMMSNSSYTLTAVAGEEVFKLWFYSSGAETATIEIGVYDITSGVSGASLIGSYSWVVPSSAGWRSHTLASAWSLTNGNTYAVAWCCTSGTIFSFQNKYVESAGQSESSLTGSSSLASSWTASTTQDADYSVYAETQTSSAGNPWYYYAQQ